MQRPKNTSRTQRSDGFDRSHGYAERRPAAQSSTSRGHSGHNRYARSQSRYTRRRSRFSLTRFFRRNPFVLPAAGAAVLIVVLLVVLISVLRPSTPDHMAVAKGTSVSTEAPTEAPTPIPTPEPTDEPVVESTDMPAVDPVTEIADDPEPASSADPAAAAMVVTIPVTPDAGMPNQFTLVAPGIPNTDRLLGLQETAWAPDSFFNDTVFVGDSVSMKLNYYVTNQRKNNPTLLGDAKFVTLTSFSSRNALKEVTSTSVHPTYQGRKMRVEDIVAQMGAKRVYIMLGLNDVGIYGYERSAENMIQLLYLIKQKSPDVQIFVQSATPRLSGDEPTTEEIFMYNMKLYEHILNLTGQDIFFVDVAYVMRDENGKLPAEYCSDADSMALHFNNTACQKWVEFLYTHVLPDQYYNATNA